MIARVALTGAFALATLASCFRDRSLQPTGPDGGPFSMACPSVSGPSMPRALIGPDASFRITCGGRASSPIASVDEQGHGITAWSISVKGDPAFTPETPTLQTCLQNSPGVAFVAFYPPMDAVPGDTFDGVATVHADDGSFADGTVALHGEVVSAKVAVSTTAIDFGDVGPSDFPGRSLDFRVLEGGHVSIMHDALAESPFSLTFVNPSGPVSMNIPDVTSWRVAFQSNVAGDYTAAVVWHGVPLGRANPAPEACLWTTTVTLHARVLADAGAGDGGEAGDGGDGGPTDAGAS
jgi:hypothetical protein